MGVKGRKVQLQTPIKHVMVSNKQHMELCEYGARWLKRHPENGAVPNCPTIATELLAATPESPDVIGWCYWCSVMIEVKVSRSDFLRDKKKPFRANPCDGVGDFRYYLCPEGLINVVDLPKDWGLLWSYSGKIVIIKKATKQQSNLMAERTMLLSLIRRSV